MSSSPYTGNSRRAGGAHAHRENQVSSRTQRVEVRNACSPRYPTVHAALHLRQLSLVPRRRGFYCAKGKSSNEVDRKGCKCTECENLKEFGLTKGYYCAEGSAEATEA